eukprot:XP_001709930.1 Hypothetical protein GL50803_23308 [Giardia lamblia ATCC 50803]
MLQAPQANSERWCSNPEGTPSKMSILLSNPCNL